MLTSNPLEQYILPNAPPTVYYIPSFLTPQESTTLLEKIYKTPKPKWVSLRNRRLQNWGVLAGHCPLSDPLPPWLTAIENRIAALGIWHQHSHANNCLINEYLPGQGILPHEDGPAFHPTIATLSLSSTCLLQLYPHGQTKASHTLFLEPGSLLVLDGEVYRGFLHGIPEQRVDVLEGVVNPVRDFGKEGGRIERGTRVSVTFRVVKKVAKVSVGRVFGKRV
ncbi:uncharacterized protein SPPG_05863 [Spizellomyces punctatus DAOM BR117]|uniref:Fe2OG dioxygenase domain-containing protein n=1 Tax=Spizellomyces punctatus (strain DAOM BR117) TaxID=645134 RepID=A0A0L0HDQ1_SPIPD|nr:uncharacterized protein SPPG_05863 [Spizellomyces punctatus DAOM BR117]KNC98898.1 hypothetical protein SPPG_05863 [Spizellomyces punctatus DAOM BR117]|eukprot:XP_016606938.1 hypothetical protein SPPG_05863 [Spizellomyces punctatus DAOM BR117]